MAIVANILAIIFGLAGFRLSISRGWAVFAFYTQISNLIALLSSAALIAFGASAAWFRYLGACMLAMTLAVTLFVLVPMGGGFERLMLSGVGLYHHTLCPLISIASYVLLEPHAHTWAIPVIVTTVYGLTMLYLNAKEVFDGPYPFFRVNKQGKVATVLWTAALIALISAISLGISALAR
ncbi:MAG: hypothetical protein Q4D39_00030 [Coriobacteriaceae bacterium]|nr:hypothetical protein [Coriobacteriaceae bacterium]